MVNRTIFCLAMYMSAQSKVMIVPAMDREMYTHPGTLENLDKFETFRSSDHRAFHRRTWPVDSVGKGRMEEPDQLYWRRSFPFFTRIYRWPGRNFLVTAGPTYERIDPVRFIGNYSSGKMGLSWQNRFHQWGSGVIWCVDR
jgi:phosphopantothenoylcysteine decarboxylase/phosphopantothenate--cysteine ligase